MKISCIGSGNMGTALMKGAASELSLGDIGFSDIDLPKAKAAAAAIGAQVYPSNTQAVMDGDFVFLAVKPQILKTVLLEIAPAVKERLLAQKNVKNSGKNSIKKSGKNPGGTKSANAKSDGKDDERPPELTLVSMAPGWSIEKIQAVIGVKAPVVRIMPNTPALVSRGVIVMAPSQEVSARTLEELEKILSGAGLVDRLEEKYLDAVTGLSGSGPAYVFLFIEALADGGVRAGLPRDKALRYAAQTVLGSASMVLETGKHPGELKDMVTSPGGTTIAGVAALENGAFRAAAINAVEAAWRRSTELG